MGKEVNVHTGNQQTRGMDVDQWFRFRSRFRSIKQQQQQQTHHKLGSGNGPPTPGGWAGGNYQNRAWNGQSGSKSSQNGHIHHPSTLGWPPSWFTTPAHGPAMPGALSEQSHTPVWTHVCLFRPVLGHLEPSAGPIWVTPHSTPKSLGLHFPDCVSEGTSPVQPPILGG